MYSYGDGEVAAANASEALGETYRLRGRVAELEQQVASLIDAVDTMAERLGITP